MKKRDFFVISFIWILVGLIFCGCDEEFYDASTDLPVIEESEAAYLLDDDFVLSSDNFSTYFHDYLFTPKAIYFGYENNHYRCEDPSASVAFADVISDVVFVEISYDEFSQITYSGDPSVNGTSSSIDFTNILHSIAFYFHDGHTYVICYRDITSPTCFMIEEDLSSDFSAVADSVLPVSEEVTNPNELTQFE